MAYKMEYGMKTPVVYSTVHVQKKQRRKPKLWIIISVCIALITVCATTDILIPGDAAVTKAAMSNMVNNIREGEQVVDAFAAFCQTVLQGG